MQTFDDDSFLSLPVTRPFARAFLFSSFSFSPLFSKSTLLTVSFFFLYRRRAQFVASRPDLTTINDILSFARVVTAKLDSASTELMADATPKTVLLPNDDGFASLEYWTNMTAYERAMKLLNETETTSFLGYHILSGGAFDSATVASLNGQTVDTCLSKTVMDTYPDSTVLDVGVEVRDPDVFIKARASEAKVVEADIPVCEGIVHVIDAPLLLCDTEMEFTDEEKTVVETAVTKVAEMLEKYEEAMAPAPAPMEDETVMPMEAGAEEPQA